MADLEPEMCFACGRDNPIGLKLTFCDEGDTLSTVFTPGNEHQGWPGWTHGGLVLTVLDEAMAQWCWRRGMAAMTAEMRVRFRQALPVGRAITVRAWLVRERGRLMELTAEARLDDGKLVAETTAKFMRAGQVPGTGNEAR